MHIYQSPHRLLCVWMSPKLYEVPGKQYESNFGHPGFLLYEFARKQYAGVFGLIFAALFTILFPMYVFEQLVCTPAVVGFTIVVVGYYAVARRHGLVERRNSQKL